MTSPTATSGDKSLIDHIPTQYSPIIQTPFSPIILTPLSTRLVGAADDDTVSVMNYTKPRPQSEETIIRAAYSPTPQVERLVDSVEKDEHVDSAKQDTTPNDQVSSSGDMNEKASDSSSALTEVIVSKSDITSSQLTESSLITLVDIDSKSSTIHPQPLHSTVIAVPNIMMVSPKNNKTRLVKGVRFEKSVRDNGAQQVRATNQHLSKKETDHNHQQEQTRNVVTRKHQNLARFALVVLTCLYMLCCGMLGWAGMKAVSSVGVLFLDPPRMIKQINEAFVDAVCIGEQPTTPSLLDNKSCSLLFYQTKHKVSRLGMIWYTSISEELLEIDDVNNGMMMI